MRSALLLLAFTIVFPRTSSADLALTACMDAGPVIAQAMLDAEVILLARIESIDETEQPTARGWRYGWETRIRVEQVWRGRHPASTARFDSSCSGTARSSRNHCQQPPAAKGQRVVLFLKRGTDGKLHLAQPSFGVFGRCPDASLVERAKKQDGRLFRRLLGAGR